MVLCPRTAGQDKSNMAFVRRSLSQLLEGFGENASAKSVERRPQGVAFDFGNGLRQPVFNGRIEHRKKTPFKLVYCFINLCALNVCQQLNIELNAFFALSKSRAAISLHDIESDVSLRRIGHCVDE